jgi:hypothetical protein
MVDADTTTALAPLEEDGALERSFFAGVEDDTVLASSDPILERKQSPAVAARRARLSWAVKAVVVGAAMLCAWAAATRLSPGDGQSADAGGTIAPAR